jgi:hypothetical protein
MVEDLRIVVPGQPAGMATWQVQADVFVVVVVTAYRACAAAMTIVPTETVKFGQPGHGAPYVHVYISPLVCMSVVT